MIDVYCCRPEVLIFDGKILHSNVLRRAIGIGGATAIGQILLTIAYRYGTASFLSPLAYITVIYNALILYFAFDQELGWRSLVGSALIIIGGTMTYIFKKQPATVLETFEHPDQKTKPPL